MQNMQVEIQYAKTNEPSPPTVYEPSSFGMTDVRNMTKNMQNMDTIYIYIIILNKFSTTEPGLKAQIESDEKIRICHCKCNM